jgi:DNA primase
MAIPPDVLDDIRARIPLSSLVGKKVKLRKAGREMKGLSPFNHEKTPSFYVNDVKQFYHCFSSGKHGDHFAWLMETEGLTFPESVQRLAEESGVKLPDRTPEDEAAYAQRRTLHDLLQLAANFYEDWLGNSAGTPGLHILNDRRISSSAVEEFQIGFAPGRYSTLTYLRDKCGFSERQIIEVGLAVEEERGAHVRDKFINRLMFPITDPQGKVIAFSGRAVGDAQPKYLNSPETPIFVKGRGLFNFHRAREAARQAGTIIVVEGNMDVVSMWQAGYRHTVAPLGTALTVDQLQLLWRHVGEPIICFDGDRAGHRAASKAIDTALPHLEPGKSLRFARMPAGEDPDSLVRKSPDLMKSVLEASVPLSEALWEIETLNGIQSPEDRSWAEHRFLEATKSICNGNVRYHMRQELMGRLKNYNGLPSSRSIPIRLPPPPMGTHKERSIAAIAAARPDLADRHVESLAQMEFMDESAEVVIRSILMAGGEKPAAAANLSIGRLHELLTTDPKNPEVDDAFRELLDLAPLQLEG